MKVNSLLNTLVMSVLMTTQASASQITNLKESLMTNPRAMVKVQGIGLSTAVLKKIYSLNQFQSYWSDDRIEKFRELSILVESHGLRSEDYYTDQVDLMPLFEKEIYLTEALYRIASDLYAGRVQPYATSPDIRFQRKEFQNFQELSQILVSDPSQMAQRILAFAPQNQMYSSLLSLRARLVELKGQGELSAIPLKNKEVPEDMLTERLQLLGYDTTVLSEAIKSFQADHVISTDGKIGKGSLALLNQSLSARILQIDANLERLRWLPEKLGETFTFVNLANQKMHVMNLDQKDMEMKVVVGKELRKTPLLIDRVVQVILNPTWTAPRSIAVKDLLPKYIKDPSYFQTKHLRVLSNGVEVFPTSEEMQKYKMHNFPYTIRQDAYPDNALGLVKFMMSNRDQIFLHDTDHRNDFQTQFRRQLSSGCIRLERPIDYAEYLLNRVQKWSDGFPLNNREVLDSVLATGAPGEVVKTEYATRLDFKMPVYTVFLSVVEENGRMIFLPDSYGQDADLIKSLESVQPESEM